MMPGGSGFDFLPTIRKMCDVPVIMLTALDEEDELVNGLDLVQMITSQSLLA